jgi:CheY-like chemotaxis protein
VKIREDSSKGPVIIGVSANAFSEDRDKALDCGMNFYISKPIQKRELMATLMKTLSFLD